MVKAGEKESCPKPVSIMLDENKESDKLSFLVFGDSGTGETEQYELAEVNERCL